MAFFGTLDTETVDRILVRIPQASFLVVGDVFLDKYMELNSQLTEPSIETGLDAYQVSNVRCSPGAAGTVINNLKSLGATHIKLLSTIGEDGEGFELKRELISRGVDCSDLIESPKRRTPTYIKPLLETDGVFHELNRIDIKNRTATPGRLVRDLSHRLDHAIAIADVVLVSDQVSEANCGVIGLAMRERLSELGQRFPEKLILVDSRENIGLFRHCSLKPNRTECLRGIGAPASANLTQLSEAVRDMARICNRAVFCTIGVEGSLVSNGEQSEHVPAVRVPNQIDVVGAGDSVNAAIACALFAGASRIQAAEFGNLVASITIQQIGTTGSATPEQVRALVEK